LPALDELLPRVWMELHEDLLVSLDLTRSGADAPEPTVTPKKAQHLGRWLSRDTRRAFGSILLAKPGLLQSADGAAKSLRTR